jgi:triacylglycerol lipase
MEPPVLLVHGIWDSAARLEPLRAGLSTRGVTRVGALDLSPNDGRAHIEALGEQVDREARTLMATHGAEQIDLVGFSMGALVSRWWIQRSNGRHLVRRFISLAGPHQGTVTAYALPLEGVREMRPGSALLRDLASDTDPWGAVEAHAFYTPYDLMVVPGRSGVLRGARTVRAVPVKLHRWMLSDSTVLDAVARILTRR